MADASVLNNKHILLFSNLPGKKMRGIKSEGMLLTTEKSKSESKLEVVPLDCGEFAVGDCALLDGTLQEN